jgi:hypothetical protein
LACWLAIPDQSPKLFWRKKSYLAQVVVIKSCNSNAVRQQIFVTPAIFDISKELLILNQISGGTVGSYTLNAQCAAGSATINVRNETAGSLSEAIVIQFALIKAVNA